MIYFIQNTRSKAIKIGIGKTPADRLAAFQTANHDRVILIGVMEGGRVEEQDLHQQFTRKRGEWFEPTPALLKFIKENAVLSDMLKPPQGRRRPRRDAWAEYRPELRTHDMWGLLARMSVYVGDTRQVLNIVRDEIAEYCPGYTFEEVYQKVQHLVNIQNS